MSTVKSPPEKKELSLAFDRRNGYGENSKASRKNIPRGKKRSHRKERRGVAQLLASIPFRPDSENVLATSLAVKVFSRRAKLRSFKKSPDDPLGQTLEIKSLRRLRRAGALIDSEAKERAFMPAVAWVAAARKCAHRVAAGVQSGKP
jgi:hypothetical protein